MCKAVKRYIENDVKYQFDCEKMKAFITKRRRDILASDKKVPQYIIWQELADQLFVSQDAVKSWVYGNNGPSDLEQVRKIADYFDIDYHELLKTEETKMNTSKVEYEEQISVQQRMLTHASVREVYVSLIEALDKVWEYYDAERKGLYDKYTEEEMIEKNITTFEVAEDAIYNVAKLMTKYYLDIPQSLYEEISKWFVEHLKVQIMNIACIFMPMMSEDDPEELEDLKNDRKLNERRATEYRDGVYYRQLMDIFSDYVLPM